MILFFDTETTGKCDFRADPDAPHQPRLVELAALLCSDLGKEVASVSLIVKPDGFEIPEEASQLHGITTEIALARGVEENLALAIFDRFLDMADVAAAHNVDFDRLVLSRGCHERRRKLANKGVCTMKPMTDYCRLPGHYGYKWPTLQEAYQRAFARDFDGAAHSALADVRACKDIYFWLQAERTRSAGAKYPAHKPNHEEME